MEKLYMFKKVMPLSLIIAFRFLGLFIVLPVLSIYALSLPGATPTLVGIIIGGFALTQMIFQVPFGMMSDMLGRKGTIITGLLLFAIGSILCALSTDVLTLLLGRLLQGAGAVAAVISAMVSDLVKEEERPKAMAIMGGFIAISFALAMIIGPIISGFTGVEALFWITALLALASIVILVRAVPDAPKVTHTYHNVGKLEFLKKSEILKMNLSNFLQKGFMTFAFMIIPIVMTKTYGWELSELWMLYIPAMIAGILAMGPAAVLAQKKGKYKEVMILGIIFFALSYFSFGNSESQTFFIAAVVLFFIGFNMHEPIMQSLTTKYIKVHERGKVLGLFNSFGYFGTFLGGIIGGIYLVEVDGTYHQGISEISTILLIISVAWLAIMFTLPNPHKQKNIYMPLEGLEETKFNSLDDLDGIEEWYINNTENIIVIKYDEDITDEQTVKSTIQ
jgi:MFS family permease